MNREQLSLIDELQLDTHNGSVVAIAAVTVDSNGSIHQIMIGVDRERIPILGAMRILERDILTEIRTAQEQLEIDYLAGEEDEDDDE